MGQTGETARLWPGLDKCIVEKARRWRTRVSGQNTVVRLTCDVARLFIWLVVVVQIPRKNLHLQLVSSTAVPLHLPDPKHVHLGPRGELAEGWLDPQLSYARKTLFLGEGVVGLVWASLTLSCLLLLYFFLKEKKKTTFQSFAEFTHEDSTNKFLTWKIKDIYVQCTKRKVFLTSESWCLYSLTKQRIMFERQGLTQTFLVF